MSCRKGFTLTNGVCMMELSNENTVCKDGSKCETRTTCDANNICTTDNTFSCSDNTKCEITTYANTCPENSVFLENSCLDSLKLEKVKLQIQSSLDVSSNTFIFSGSEGTLLFDPDNFSLKVSSNKLGDFYTFTDDIKLDEMAKVIDFVGPEGPITIRLADGVILKNIETIEYDDKEYNLDKNSKSGKWYSSKKVYIGFGVIITLIVILILLRLFKG